MKRLSSSAKKLYTQILPHHHRISPRNGPVPQKPSCDIFINHRGIDTKKNVAGLLYDHLSMLNYSPFLDSKNMKPGDKLFENIDPAILRCKLAIVVFSPRYCDSYFCLHELALITEAKKRFVPVFCDVKPSELSVKDDGSCSKHDLYRFQRALEEAKYTVGLAFDTSNGDWPGFLMSAMDAVMKNLQEVEEGRGAGRSTGKNVTRLRFP